MGWIPCSGKSSGRTKTRRNADQKLNRKSSDCSVSTSVAKVVYKTASFKKQHWIF
ncbi:hypothetical protein ARALYDRAFT_918497 [Arabidopsis lyrata subsp. lyrata]|uniref:Uncharacterized protein n=1 Tax=Arabidopsis lyrata subsp. lyrata TaxID=81972 RepID=D7MTM0_ARALL|nr:hypothetical protein ARALYDRAFT_918497 [Arabidopsis lyrata subsp. lyrata]